MIKSTSSQSTLKRIRIGSLGEIMDIKHYVGAEGEYPIFVLHDTTPNKIYK